MPHTATEEDYQKLMIKISEYGIINREADYKDPEFRKDVWLWLLKKSKKRLENYEKS